MNALEALERARKIVAKNTVGGEYEPDGGHPELDDLLCDVLRSLGYGELVDFYLAQDRWFE